MPLSKPTSPVNNGGGSRANSQSPTAVVTPGVVVHAEPAALPTTPLKSILKNRNEHSPIAPNSSAIYHLSSDEDDEGSGLEGRVISANQNTLPNNLQFSGIKDSRILDKEKMKLGKAKIRSKKPSRLQLSHEKRHSLDGDEHHDHEDKSPQGPSTSNKSGGGSGSNQGEDRHQRT